MRVAQLGVGRWGTNLLRVFSGLDGVELVAVCDPDPAVAERVPPGVALHADEDALFARDDVDALVVATPPELHHRQGLRSLERGWHTYVEKPLARSAAEAHELVERAERRGLVLMVGHVVLYDDAVRWVKAFLDRGELGEVYYAYLQRLNLGTVRQDVDALWNLAVHDVTIANYWLGEVPDRVTKTGVSFLQEGIDDVCFVNMHYPSGRFAHVHVSWLDPTKTRNVVLVGSQKMVVYDDTSRERPIAVYDKGIDRERLGPGGRAPARLVPRAGPVWSPRLERRDALTTQAEDFVASIREGRSPLADGRSGAAVIEVLEAADRSAPARPGWGLDAVASAGR